MSSSDSISSEASFSRRTVPGLISLAVSLCVLFFKCLAYFYTGSQIIFSDAIEGITHVVGTASAYFLLRLSSRPPDVSHPYGHGKSEYFSASFEGGLISCAALTIIVFALQSLISGHELTNLGVGVWLMAGNGVLNLALGLYLLSSSKRYNSSALKGSGLHVLSDAITSAAGLAGLVLVRWTGLLWLDPALALLAGVYLAFTGAKLVRQSFGRLMDEQDIAQVKKFAAACNNCLVPGIIKIHNVRMIHSGHFDYIDAHVVVPEFWSVQLAHDEIINFEKMLLAHYPNPAEVHFHIDPCLRKHCAECDLPNCPIRQTNFAERRPYFAETLAGGRDSES